MVEARRSIRFHGQPVAEAARVLIDAIVQRQGDARLAVAGGSAAPVLGAVRRGLPSGLWPRLRLTWVDERCVPFAHPESNRGAAYRGGHLDLQDPPGLELPLYLDGESPQAACGRVAEEFQKGFDGHLDLLLLGTGEDGHIASLFPGHPWNEAPVFVVTDSPKPPAQRVTFGLAVLAQAPLAVLLALGTAKKDALERIRNGDPALPATALRNLLAFTDLPAFISE